MVASVCMVACASLKIEEGSEISSIVFCKSLASEVSVHVSREPRWHDVQNLSVGQSQPQMSLKHRPTFWGNVANTTFSAFCLIFS